MSFDLYFTKKIITKDEFTEYFQNQEYFSIDNTQAIYENSTTGVYFIIDYNENPNDENNYCASLNVNYYRPLYFADESAIVIENFINQFNFEIFDPQNDGMGEGPYSKTGFIKSWQRGNDFGYQSILENPDAAGDIYCRPNDELYKIWQWNYYRESNCLELEKDIFIPRISYALINGKLSTFIVWPDAISTLIPEVENVLIMRSELAPKKWFKKTEDRFFVPFNSLDNILRDYKTQFKAFNSYEIPSPNTPDRIKKYVKDLSPTENDIALIANDSVLSLELVQKYNKRNTIIK